MAPSWLITLLLTAAVLPIASAMVDQDLGFNAFSKNTGVSIVNVNFTAGTGKTRQLNATIWFPKDGVQNGLPFLYMLNGFNVESYWYSSLMQTLAGKGYLAAAVDYHQPSKFPQSQPPKPGCPNDTVDVTTAGTLNTVWDYLFKEDQEHMPLDLAAALNHLSPDAAKSLVLLGHSYGGSTAYSVLTGKCDDASGLQGKSDPAANLDTGCYGYSPIIDPTNGRNVLKGLVVYEGLPYQMPITPLLPGTFAMEISGQYKGAKEAKTDDPSMQFIA
ncbi:hypothetical protein WJX73_010300 [Symbiochloris irregularis]|uniref:Chlorophyllase n=1 Tax=Symbiochloris irregularis TaxID=706552 RepID=A0AAW1PJH6_9CHLO